MPSVRSLPPSKSLWGFAKVAAQLGVKKPFVLGVFREQKRGMLIEAQRIEEMVMNRHEPA